MKHLQGRRRNNHRSPLTAHRSQLAARRLCSRYFLLLTFGPAESCRQISFRNINNDGNMTSFIIVVIIINNVFENCNLIVK